MSLFPRAAVWAVGLALGACSPTFNWRALRVDTSGLQATLPCKPERAIRALPLAGAPVDVHMHSCEAGGLRFAVAWADVAQLNQVPVALAAWRKASLQTLRVPLAAADQAALGWAVRVAGAPDAQGLSAQGQNPQGQPVQTRAVYFAQGTRVFQAAVYGATLPDEPVDAFFSGLKLSPP